MEPIEDEKLSAVSRGEPRRAELPAELERGAARGAKPPLGTWSAASGARARGSPARRYSVDERRTLLAALERSDESMKDFAAREGVSTATLCKWRRELAARGEAGLKPKENPRNRACVTGKHFAPEVRRQAIETLAKSGLTQRGFAKL